MFSKLVNIMWGNLSKYSRLAFIKNMHFLFVIMGGGHLGLELNWVKSE